MKECVRLAFVYVATIDVNLSRRLQYNVGFLLERRVISWLRLSFLTIPFQNHLNRPPDLQTFHSSLLFVCSVRVSIFKITNLYHFNI